MRQRARQAPWRAATAALALVMLPACAEPQPNYSPLEQPVVGIVAAEMSVVASGGAQRIDLAADEDTHRARLIVHVPAGAYPAGTKVTARLVRELDLPVDACVVLTLLLSHWAGDDYLALQILPQQPPPAVPLRVEYQPSIDHWFYQTLHAKPGAAWTVVDTFVQSSSPLAFAVAEPGLWTVAQLHFPPSLQGRWQRTEVTCSNGDVIANDPPVVIDLAGDSFTWARPSPGMTCYKVSSGRVTWECASDWQAQRFTLSPSRDAEIDIDSYELDDAGTGIWWQRASWSSECSKQAIQREHFVWQGNDPPPIPTLTDAGTCPADKDGGP